jgi:hypothetical protein
MRRIVRILSTHHGVPVFDGRNKSGDLTVRLAGEKGTNMLSTLLLVLLILVLVGVTPLWPYSRQWGYTPSSVVGVVLLVVLVLALMGRV